MKIRSEVFCIVYNSSSSILTPFKGISTGIEIYIPTLFGYFPPTCPPAFCNPHNIHLQSFHFLHNFAMFSYFTKGSGIPWCHPHLNNCVPVFSFRSIGLVWISPAGVRAQPPWHCLVNASALNSLFWSFHADDPEV